MTSEEQAAVVAELESTKTALQGARKELAASKDRENKLLDAAREQDSASSGTFERGSASRRYAEYLILMAIVALAAWQMYLTRLLHGLLA
jgi:hypothetical protein